MFEAARDAVAGASAHASDRWLYAWALGYAAVGAASLLVPLYAIALGGSPLVTGLAEATAGLAGVPGALLWGRLADRTGDRRGFVLVSLAGTGVVLAVLPLLDSVAAVLVANAVLWFAVAAASPVVTLFMVERAAPADWERRIGLLNAYQRYGWVGGLLVGAAWLGAARGAGTLAAQRWLFVACAAAAILATPLAFYWLPPAATNSAQSLARAPDALLRLTVGGARYVKLVPYAPGRAAMALRHGRPLSRLPRPLRRYLLAVTVFSAGFAVFFGPAPAFLADLPYDDATIFGVFILSNAASAVAFVPVGDRAAAGGSRLLQLGALGVRVVLFPGVGVVGALPTLLLRDLGVAGAFVLVGITWAVVAVTAAGLVSRAAPDRIRGEALGLYAALSGLGGGVGGVAGGWLALVAGYGVAFGVAGAVVLLGGLGVVASGVGRLPGR